ncbi:flagellar biosynthesis protein FlgB [Caulobacter sp. S45]|jgi:flagellar basal-body rod protein FlgB|uniref:flagellar biosynthesis protein FlgB n=1 Tax=Caulobacter sp. S45 TaxID=1641861 RepID=UPI00131DF1D2|nr:flagellar biosynthesis protein FlgB [Caulobacter sp. S45]
MSLDSIPLMQIIKGKLDYTNQRERVISENVANADTPGFAPRDLKPFTVEAAMTPHARPAGLDRTNVQHLTGTLIGGGDPYTAKEAPDSETRLDGNQVVLEEQMSKMTQSRIDYEAAVDFYQQSMNLISTAAKEPGK